VTNASSRVNQITSQFNTCQGPAVISVSNGKSCTAAANLQVTSASAALEDAFQSSTQILSEISASVTVGETAEAINQTTHLAQSMLQQVSKRRRSVCSSQQLPTLNQPLGQLKTAAILP